MEHQEYYGFQQGSAPIDEKYFHFSGMASEFEQAFDHHVCSYHDLWEHFRPTIVQANKSHGNGEDEANMVGACFEQKKQSLTRGTD